MLQPETSGTSHQTVRSAGADVHTLRRGTSLDYQPCDLQLSPKQPKGVKPTVGSESVNPKPATMKQETLNPKAIFSKAIILKRNVVSEA